MDVTSLAENVAQYFLETNTFPTSLAALAATPGFEQARGMEDSWEGYAVSPAIADMTWDFQRAVLESNDPSKGIDAATYLATNNCGTGGYDTAISWCGSPTGLWYRSETRENYAAQISTERGRMHRFEQKLAEYYNANQSFPDKDSGGTSLGADSVTTLAALASFGGTADTCSGTFSYMGVPVDCADIYDLWGQPIGYQFMNSKHIVLVSEPPIFNNLGNRVVVASDFDNSLLN